MTTTITVEGTFGPDGALAKKLPNYRDRPQQVALSEQIDRAFSEGFYLVAEAPTGVGKSLAGLVPAFDKIINEDARVLVVTSSIVLQGQYMQKDIPFLEDLYDTKVHPVLIKGKNNYVCPRKVQSTSHAANVHPSKMGQYEHVRGWARTTRTGSFSELPFELAPDVRRATAVTEPADCKGKRCPLYNACHYYENKKKLRTAKVVVCNYHYLFTSFEIGDFDMMLGGDFDYVIYDEAHEIVNIARDFLGKKVTRDALEHSVTRLHSLANAVKGSGDVLELVEGFMDIDYARWKLGFSDTFDGIYRLMINEREQRKDYLPYHGERKMKEALEDVLNRLTKFDNDFSRYINKYFPDDWVERDDYPDVVKDWMHECSTLVDHIGEVKRSVRMMLAEDVAFLTWAEERKSRTMPDDVQLVIKPIDVSGLVSSLYEQFEGGVLMSATMSVGGEVDYFAKQLGVPEDLRLDFITETPFNLTENLLWYLPGDCPEGTNSDHGANTVREMHRVASTLKGRTLCLFTSNRNLQLAMDYFSQHPIHGTRIMSQKEHQKERIIEAMRSNEDVIVLGTKSFFTGVDIQGRNLSAVLIDKIPFPMTGDPINAYLADLRNGFGNHMLPEAIITLKQAVGRLNRTEDDKGLVAVFDGRLRTKNYKHRIFKSFGFRVNGASSYDVVAPFLEAL